MTSMRVRQPSTSARKEVARAGLVDGNEVGHCLRDRDGVHGDVGQVDPGHRALGRTPEVGLGQVIGRDPGQEVRRVHHEVVVQPHLARDGTGRLFGHGHEDVGRGGIGPALEQPGQQEVSLLPAHEILVLVAGLGPWQQPLRLELDENRRHEEELGQLVEVDLLALLREHTHEAVDHGQEGDVEDVDLVGRNEMQQEVDGTLETWRPDRVGHPLTLPNRPTPFVHP